MRIKEKSDTKKSGFEELSYSLRESIEIQKSIKSIVDSWPEWKIQAYDFNERRSIKDSRSLFVLVD